MSVGNIGGAGLQPVQLNKAPGQEAGAVAVMGKMGARTAEHVQIDKSSNVFKAALEWALDKFTGIFRRNSDEPRHMENMSKGKSEAEIVEEYFEAGMKNLHNPKLVLQQVAKAVEQLKLGQEGHQALAQLCMEQGKLLEQQDLAQAIELYDMALAEFLNADMPLDAQAVLGLSVAARLAKKNMNPLEGPGLDELIALIQELGLGEIVTKDLRKSVVEAYISKGIENLAEPSQVLQLFGQVKQLIDKYELGSDAYEDFAAFCKERGAGAEGDTQIAFADMEFAAELAGGMGLEAETTLERSVALRLARQNADPFEGPDLDKLIVLIHETGLDEDRKKDFKKKAIRHYLEAGVKKTTDPAVAWEIFDKASSFIKNVGAGDAGYRDLGMIYQDIAQKTPEGELKATFFDIAFRLELAFGNEQRAEVLLDLCLEAHLSPQIDTPSEGLEVILESIKDSSLSAAQKAYFADKVVRVSAQTLGLRDPDMANQQIQAIFAIAEGLEFDVSGVASEVLDTFLKNAARKDPRAASADYKLAIAVEKWVHEGVKKTAYQQEILSACLERGYYQIAIDYAAQSGDLDAKVKFLLDLYEKSDGLKALDGGAFRRFQTFVEKNNLQEIVLRKSNSAWKGLVGRGDVNVQAEIDKLLAAKREKIEAFTGAYSVKKQALAQQLKQSGLESQEILEGRRQAAAIDLASVTGLALGSNHAFLSPDQGVALFAEVMSTLLSEGADLAILKTVFDKILSPEVPFSLDEREPYLKAAARLIQQQKDPKIIELLSESIQRPLQGLDYVNLRLLSDLSSALTVMCRQANLGTLAESFASQNTYANNTLMQMAMADPDVIARRLRTEKTMAIHDAQQAFNRAQAAYVAARERQKEVNHRNKGDGHEAVLARHEAAKSVAVEGRKLAAKKLAQQRLHSRK